ncbi:MAG: Na+/H+ antiporter NhaC [Brevinema sp.]
MTQPRDTKIWHVVVIFTILIGCLVFGLGILQTSSHIPLFLAAMLIGAFAVFVLGYQWETLQNSIFDSIRTIAIAIILLYIIGMVIATWILSGVVPTMIYYGLLIINPKFFLFSAALLCALISLPTGSSWTTAGTVGVALMGVGEGLGVPMPMTAGAVLSGAYFGDKLSPLSDTSNLAVAIADANIIDHVKHMLWTSIPAFLCALIGFLILGMNLGSDNVQTATLNTMLETLQKTYYISPTLLLVPVVVITIVMFKVPAIPGLFLGSVIGGIVALFTQEGVILTAVINAMHSGVVVETDNELINSLLSRGGMAGMHDTIALIVSIALVSGILDATKVTRILTEAIISLAHNTGQLVLATVVSAMVSNVVIADQYIAIMVTGKMFQKSYKNQGLASKNLSRVLQDSATVTSVFIPWNTCGAYMIATLGVMPWVYIPYAFFNLLMPVFSVIAAYLNFTMTTIDQEIHSKKLKEV